MFFYCSTVLHLDLAWMKSPCLQSIHACRLLKLGFQSLSSSEHIWRPIWTTAGHMSQQLTSLSDAAELGVVHGGELEVVVERGRHVEIEGPEAVPAFRRRRRRHVRALVAAQGLPGAEHAEAERALVDDRGVGAAGLASGRWHAAALAFLDAGAVAAEGLVRPEHLLACAALVPGARVPGLRLGSGPRPRVPRQHHERHGHVLLLRRIGDGARRLGIRHRRRRTPPCPLGAPSAHGEPRATARGLRVALAVLHDRRLAGRRGDPSEASA
uniref:Uncharacterized protein n=1 Tax=Triticum urartu TaxID=4572 RepID=A0A8R7K3F4_TRIUA